MTNNSSQDLATQSPAERLAAVENKIDTALGEAGRSREELTLIAVSKTQPAENIDPVIAAGQKVFGENRVQEAQGKWPQLRERFTDLELHLIGGLQTNKVRDALQLFDVIHTVDRPKLARTIANELARSDRQPQLFVQVNTGEESQKSGVDPREADEFLRQCRETYQLPIAGLMCIPPIEDEPSLHFALLRKIAQRNGISGLSMGMSADYDVAIQFGATHIRVGTAIFGPRNPPPAA